MEILQILIKFFQISQAYQNQFTNRFFSGKKYLNQSQHIIIKSPSQFLQLLIGLISIKKSDFNNRNSLANKPNSSFTQSQPARFENRGKNLIQVFHDSTSIQKKNNQETQNNSQIQKYEENTNPKYEFLDENPDEISQKSHDSHFIHADDPNDAEAKNEVLNVNFIFKTNLKSFVQCNNCSKKFESKNALFKHLNLTSFDCFNSFFLFLFYFIFFSVSSSVSQEIFIFFNFVCSLLEVSASFKLFIIIFKIMFSLFHEQNYAFRGFQYATCELKIGDQTHEICIDSGNPVSLINRKFLISIKPKAKLTHMTSPLPIRNISDKIVESNEMIHIKFIFESYTLFSFHKKNQIKACFETKLHIINEFSINLIFGNDVLMPQKISFNKITQKL